MKMTSIICRRKVLCCMFVAFILYLLLRIKAYSIKFDAVIKKSHPIDVWEYVADFSNMLKLNPTIIDFHVQEERGDYRSWIYSVTYTEHLSTFPSIHNFAVAEFEVKPDGEKFFIDSTHRTCFFMNLICLNTWSSFVFESEINVPKATRCVEHITYQCPVILSYLCQKEVLYQRRMIASNLQIEFDNEKKVRPRPEVPTDLPHPFVFKEEY
ncbi:uncharacterized protein LOC142324787 isoform X2 [Lycorma delicatula]|uniref:uncharacterized protein LOC142324787 isoform X2 n=1 Tax=Lycorma delicatula TaxID=130591 RepID=UPI003F5184D1